MIESSTSTANETAMCDGKPPVVAFDDVVLPQDGDVPLTGSISLSLHAGECVLITGPSSTGKSRLLRYVMGTATPEAGKVRLWGLDPWRAPPDEVNELRCRVGYVPDTGLLISNLSLYDNLVLPMRFHRRMTESEVARHAQELLAAFEIARLPQCAAAEAPKRLQQKIALARALSLNPELLVMDEPDQNLDGDFTRYLWQRLGEYKASGTAILAALKDDSIAAEIADRTVNVAASWHGAVWDSGEYRNA